MVSCRVGRADCRLGCPPRRIKRVAPGAALEPRRSCGDPPVMSDGHRQYFGRGSQLGPAGGPGPRPTRGARHRFGRRDRRAVVRRRGHRLESRGRAAVRVPGRRDDRPADVAARVRGAGRGHRAGPRSGPDRRADRHGRRGISVARRPADRHLRKHRPARRRPGWGERRGAHRPERHRAASRGADIHRAPRGRVRHRPHDRAERLADFAVERSERSSASRPRSCTGGTPQPGCSG